MVFGTGGGDALPAGGGSACNGLSLTANGVLDLDFHRLEVHGHLTLNGSPLPGSGAPRGFLVFDKEGVDEARLPLGNSGDFSYAVALTPGTYSIWYEPFDVSAVTQLSRSCVSDDVQPMPCVAGLIKRVSLTASGVYDLDLRSHRLSGHVTMNGQTLPNAPTARGQLMLALKDGGSAATASLGTSGTPSWSLHVLQGAYAVSYLSNDRACTPSWPMPCNSGTLRTGVSVTASGVLDLDLPAVQLSGRLTQDGSPLPESQGRGRLEFERVGAEDAQSPVLSMNAAASYSLWLLKGSYVIRWRAASGACDGRTAPQLACTGATLKGCAP